MEDDFSKVFGGGKGGEHPLSEPSPGSVVQSDSWENGKLLLNEYLIEGEIGEGGMGKVYLARSRSADHQFAVKRTKVLDEVSRRNFQTELQLWIELPEYPHLVACRFFRTIREEIAIFAQYIEGGSLADWIRDRKLTSLPQILDVAIQSAWGLHVLHEMELIHRDIKPANVLMTSDGLAKVTDFGLAAARVSAGEKPSDFGKSNFVSYGGRTPAYCSPEQADGRTLTRQSDIWSWAVSVLQMFTGEASWVAGQAANLALEEYWSNAREISLENGISPMTRPIAGILRKCFRYDPGERWSNLADVAEELKKVYRETTGRVYSRPMPPLPESCDRAKAKDGGAIELEADSSAGNLWLRMACQAAGRSCPDRDSRRAQRSISPRVRAISELAFYDEAQRILLSLVKGGRKDLELRLADLYLEKAGVHWQVEDFSAGLNCFDSAIEILRKAMASQSSHRNALRLATALSAEASSLSLVGEIRATAFLADEAIDILESLIGDKDDPSLKRRLAGACHTRANAAFEIADYDTALEFYNREIDLYESLADTIGEEHSSRLLAECYMHKANTIWASGNPKGALVWHEKAIAIWDRLVRAGHDELSRNLAKACYNKAITLRSAGDIRSALEWHDRSVQNYERLVHQQGQWRIANELANVYIARANAMCDTSQSAESLAWYEKAIDIYDTLANQQGRQEFSGDLARVRALYASTLSHLGEHDRALMEAERAIPVLEREVARTGRSDLKSSLRRIRNIIQK